MKISIVGGGPAGLYFSILMKKAWPHHEITIYEQNRHDDTFGFGVVFSDQTLEIFEQYDPESYELITENFAYWDDIAIHFKGAVQRIGGNGFCGCSRRTASWSSLWSAPGRGGRAITVWRIAPLFCSRGTRWSSSGDGKQWRRWRESASDEPALPTQM